MLVFVNSAASFFWSWVLGEFKSSGCSHMTSQIKPRKTPRQERSQAVVENIVAAAHRLIVEGGVEKLTTNGIAAEAGLSIGSLYQYFPNKEAIILVLAERWLALFLPVSQAYIDKASPRTWSEFEDDIRQFNAEIAGLYAANRALLSVIDAMQYSADLRAIIEAHDVKVVSNHAQWFRKVYPPLSEGDAERLALIMFQTGDACFAKAALRGTEFLLSTRDDVETMISSLLRRYLKVPD